MSAAQTFFTNIAAHMTETRVSVVIVEVEKNHQKSLSLSLETERGSMSLKLTVGDLRGMEAIFREALEHYFP